ncbi:hypothetical protein PoMZ_09600 [Pyricularia oryzae]|uniref:Tyrosinase copper-binding domain-containing protein n=1 Tax=Pyricularia oryzae TaxID=318829 RepID=A0A4P7N219_PYROR|nr:hypothetical protein PoMZ_09600 [Pyricularia oryzae]
MRPFSCLAAFAALASTAAAIPTAQSAAPNGLEDAKRNFEKNVSGITRGKMAKLKDLTKEERLDYVNAVKCLMKLPAKTPQEVAPGAKSRVVCRLQRPAHPKRRFKVHYTGNFQAWHRWFVFNYERALGEECAYKGYQPYWDWAKHATAPENLGGNGAAIPHDGPVIAPPPGIKAPTIQLPPGLGGGPVTEGPFANMTITLGPVALTDVPPGPMGALATTRGRPRGTLQNRKATNRSFNALDRSGKGLLRIPALVERASQPAY